MVASYAHSGAFADQRVTIGTYIWDKNPDNNASELPVMNQWNFQDGLKPTWRDSLLLEPRLQSLRRTQDYPRHQLWLLSFGIL